MQKFCGDNLFSYICGGRNLCRRSQNYMEGVIFINTLSLFHFLKNSQHPEKWSISFKNFFRNCEYIRSCYLMISSNLIKKSFRKFFCVCLLWQLFWKKSVLLAAHFKLLYVIIVIKILEKYWWRTSLLEIKTIHKTGSNNST